MNNINDKRNSSNWPLTVTGIARTTVTVNMAGSAGYTAITSGAAGTGTVTDATNNSYQVTLPGTGAGASKPFTVTFQRA